MMDIPESPRTRVDPFLGTVVHVVGTRQARPNLPSTGCPFCPGGLEAPEPYDVRWFQNRWPAMEGGRCEVVLYTPLHDATFPSLGVAGARKVIDLWANRTAELGARDDVDYVLVFENRGPEVGATIAHPHGQIYAYDHVPSRQSRRLAGGWTPDKASDERLVAEVA
jgi:UDPglucose--hexose-1-phosphate uridylyltransferase